MGQTIWIARHGLRLDFNNDKWEDPNGFNDDPGLSPAGLVQAVELAERLKNEGIRHIFCSPFLRTIQTANEVDRVLHWGIKIEPGLGERHDKLFFKKAPILIPLAEKQKMFPDIDISCQSGVKPVYPETREDCERRVGRAVQYLLEHYKEDMLLVGHGASVDAAAWYLLGEKVKINSDLCCIVKIVRQPHRWVLEINNDVSHLSQPVLGVPTGIES